MNISKKVLMPLAVAASTIATISIPSSSSEPQRQAYFTETTKNTQEQNIQQLKKEFDITIHHSERFAIADITYSTITDEEAVKAVSTLLETLEFYKKNNILSHFRGINFYLGKNIIESKKVVSNTTVEGVVTKNNLHPTYINLVNSVGGICIVKEKTILLGIDQDNVFSERQLKRNTHHECYHWLDIVVGDIAYPTQKELSGPKITFNTILSKLVHDPRTAESFYKLQPRNFLSGITNFPGVYFEDSLKVGTPKIPQGFIGDLRDSFVRTYASLNEKEDKACLVEELFDQPQVIQDKLFAKNNEFFASKVGGILSDYQRWSAGKISGIVFDKLKPEASSEYFKENFYYLLSQEEFGTFRENPAESFETTFKKSLEIQKHYKAIAIENERQKPQQILFALEWLYNMKKLPKKPTKNEFFVQFHTLELYEAYKHPERYPEKYRNILLFVKDNLQDE